MKSYERQHAHQFDPKQPVILRLDGRSFSMYTKDLERPFDKRFQTLMLGVTIVLAEEFDAVIGYTQSDEITLVLYNPNPNAQMFFGGKLQKLVSISAALASSAFNTSKPCTWERKGLALFDSRAFSVPNIAEAYNAVLWRHQDCVRNSIQSLGRAHFSHKALNKKSTSDIRDMLLAKGIDWKDETAFSKYGRIVRRRKVMRKFTAEELEKLPPLHQARQNPDLEIARNHMDFHSFDFALLKNKLQFFFEGEEGKFHDEE